MSKLPVLYGSFNGPGTFFILMSYEKHEVSFHIMFRKTGNKKKRSEKDNSKYVTVTKLHIS